LTGASGAHPQLKIKKEFIMIQQAWSRTAIVWDAILLGGAVLITIVAGAYQLSQGATISGGRSSYKVADGLDASPADGSIIIECMALGDRAAPDLGASRDSLTPLLVTIPRYQLGPSKCWSDEHKTS
jgi:hypothetical protein